VKFLLPSKISVEQPKRFGIVYPSEARSGRETEKNQRISHMKIEFQTGEQIKRDNGSGYRLADAFPKRRFSDRCLYAVRYNGISLDNSTVESITRAKGGSR